MSTRPDIDAEDHDIRLSQPAQWWDTSVVHGGGSELTEDLELRLIGAPTSAGEIAIKDLAALATALQELTTRIGRGVIGTSAPGHIRRSMDTFTQLRLTGITAGSTVLEFSSGRSEGSPEQQLAIDRFWDIIESIGTGRRPEWATDPVATSAEKLVAALKDAAPRAAVRGSAHPEVAIDTRLVRMEAWSSRPNRTGTRTTTYGMLEKVDLRSHRFRIRDDVGHAVDLHGVENDRLAAGLIGQWVAARGVAVRTAAGDLVSLDNAVVDAVDDPAAAYFDGRSQSVDQILAGAPGPIAGEGFDLTDEEFAAFLEAARG